MDMLNILLGLMRIVTGSFSSMTESDKQAVYQDMMFWFQKLLIDAASAISAVGNMIYSMIFDNSVMGKFVKEMINFICTLMKWIINDVWAGFLCPLAEKLAPPFLNMAIFVLNMVLAIVEGLNKLACAFGSCIPTDGISNAKQSVTNTLIHIQNGGLNCKNQTLDRCFLMDEDDPKLLALPVATRCWTGYQPSPGDVSALSCTHADTCYDFTDNTEKVCTYCPVQAGEDFMSFACSSLTKKCTCGVQRFERTQCRSHEECYGAGNFFSFMCIFLFHVYV